MQGVLRSETNPCSRHDQRDKMDICAALRLSLTARSLFFAVSLTAESFLPFDPFFNYTAFPLPLTSKVKGSLHIGCRRLSYYVCANISMESQTSVSLLILLTLEN